MRTAIPCLAALVLLGPAQGCGDSARTAKPEPATQPANTFASSFSARRAWEHLAAQCAMGPRAHGLPGQAKVQSYIRDHLRRCGVEPRDMAFTFNSSRDPAPVPFVNISARFVGDSERWVLIGTHYDTRLWADVDPDPARQNEPIEGANDGGSGTAVMLEIASVLHERKPPLSVELVFFDGEDYGRPGSADYFVGSRALAQAWSSVHGSKPEAVIILDMVGDADLEFAREANADAKHAWLNDHIWRAGKAVAPLAFGKETRPVWDDHSALLEIGIPATLLIDFEYPWWHTVGDTLGKCSPESLGITGRTVLGALLDQPLPAR